MRNERSGISWLLLRGCLSLSMLFLVVLEVLDNIWVFVLWLVRSVIVVLNCVGHDSWVDNVEEMFIEWYFNDCFRFVIDRV